MMDVADIQELYRYNQWANDRAFEAASGLTLEEFTRDLGNSYPSVRDTLTHVVWAEWIWLQRWKGNSPQHRFSAAEFPDVNALNTRWVALKTEQRAVIESITAERLGAVVEYVNFGSTHSVSALAPDVPRCESFDVSPRSAHDDAASTGKGAGPDGLSGVPRRARPWQ